MTKMTWVAMAVSAAVLGALPAFAAGPMLGMAELGNSAPVVNTPSTCGALGPSVDVSGSLGHKGLVVVLAEIQPSGSSQSPAIIPGLRHWTDSQGNFAVRIAVPQSLAAISGQSMSPTVANIRVYEILNGTSRGPETVLTCHPSAGM